MQCRPIRLGLHPLGMWRKPCGIQPAKKGQGRPAQRRWVGHQTLRTLEAVPQVSQYREGCEPGRREQRRAAPAGKANGNPPSFGAKRWLT